MKTIYSKADLDAVAKRVKRQNRSEQIEKYREPAIIMILLLAYFFVTLFMVEL